jgi:hypothetical protein
VQSQELAPRLSGDLRDSDISKEELKRRMRVFGGNYFGMSSTINLHGVEFRAVR